MAETNRTIIAAEDKVPFRKKLAYALGGPVDILSVIFQNPGLQTMRIPEVII